MYQRIGALPQLSNRPLLYNIETLITHPKHATTYTKQNLVRGIVQEKLQDNRYSVLVPRIGNEPVTVKRLLPETLKPGDPVWVMFEDNDIMLPVAVKAALDDPIPSIVPLQTLSQVNPNIVPNRVGNELFLNIEGNVSLPREILKSDRVNTRSVNLRPGIINLIRKNRVVQKGQLRLHNQIKYKVEASPAVELTTSTLNSTKDLALREVTTGIKDISVEPLPNTHDVPLQTDKPIAYIPDLQIDMFSDILDLNINMHNKQQLLEERLESEIITDQILDFDFGKMVDNLVDDLYEPIFDLIHSMDDSLADEFEFFGSRKRVQVKKDRIFTVFQQLITNIQTFNAQVNFINSVQSGVVFEPARRLIVRNFRKADLVTRFIELQNSTYYFLIVPDLTAIKDFMSFMNKKQIIQWFTDLKIDTSLITPFQKHNNTFDIVQDTGLGQDQITEIIAKLGESAGSAIAVLLLLQKLGNAFVNVVGQYLDSKLINVTDQNIFDLAVIQLFGDNINFNALNKFGISIQDLIKFISPSIDPRKPISNLAFHASELLFMDDVFWFESGNVVVSPQMLLEVFSIKTQPKIFVNTNNQYQKNLEIIFKKLLPILTNEEIQNIVSLNLGKLGRSATDTISMIDIAVKMLNSLISNLKDDNLNDILDQLGTNLDINSNPLLLVLNNVLISVLHNLLRNTQLSVQNIKTVFNWYKRQMLLLKRDLESGKVKLFNIKMGSGFVIRIDDKLTLNRRLSGQVNGIEIDPRYPDFGLDVSLTPSTQSAMYFSPDVEVQNFGVDGVPLIQISKFRSNPEQPFKYYILFKPIEMEFWIDGDNNVVIRANKILLEGKDDIIIKSDRNIMMLANGGILQQSGSSQVPESTVQGTLAGNHVIASANNVMIFSNEQIKQVSLARGARQLGKQIVSGVIDKPSIPIL